MKALLFPIAACLAAVAALSLFRPDGRSLAEDLRLLLVAEPARSAEMAAKGEAIDRCYRAKREVLKEVLAGHLGLEGAAERFERLDTEKGWPVSRDESRRAVLEWVSSELRERPQERRQVLGRLRTPAVAPAAT